MTSDRHPAAELVKQSREHPGAPFDPNEVWVRAAQARSFRLRLLVEKSRKVGLAARLYPLRLPSLVADQRRIKAVRPGADSVTCSLGTFKIDSPSATAQLREVAISGAYAAPGFVPHSGWAVVDAGANLGFYAAWAASFMSTGRLLAIEAVPQTASVLAENVAALRARGVSVRVVVKAVSDRAQVLQFACPAGLSQYSRAADRIRDDTRFADVPLQPVEAETLDKILGDEGWSGRRIDLLKMDVEGAESDCLAGATESLKNVQRVVFEYHSSRLLSDCGERLAGAGFKHVLTRQGFLPGSEVGVSFWRRSQR